MKKALKVLFFAFDLNHSSGWNHCSLETIRSIRNRGHEVRAVIARNSSASNGHDFEALQLLWSPTQDRASFLWFPYNPLLLRKLCLWPDIVHVTVETLSVLSWLFVRKTRPMVFTGIGTYSVEPLTRPIVGPLFKKAWQNAAEIVAISRYTKNRIEQAHKKSAITAIPLGCTLPSHLAEDRPVWKNAPRILAVGALRKRKDFKTAIRALARVRQTIPGATLCIAGDTTNAGVLAGLRSEIEILNLTEAVEIMGFVNNAELDRLYRNSQAFVLTSISSGKNFEGFGLVYLEANSYGLPVIGSLDSGAEDAISDGISGRLVPPQNPEATASALVEILENPIRWNLYSQRAMAHAKSMSWDRYGKRLEEIYYRLLETRTTSSF